MSKIKYLLGLSLVSALLLTACGGGEAPTEETTTEEAAVETSNELTYDNAPEGCPSKNTITYSSNSIPETTLEAMSAYAITRVPVPENLKIFINNFEEFDTKYPYPEKSGDDTTIKLELTAPKEIGVTVSDYVGDPAATHYANFGISTAETSIGIAGIENKDLKLSHYDSEFACGTFSATDGYTTMEGEFIAEVVLNQ